ncbi:hypothetical protein EON63_22175 [archaeon]|nr:MAG: hypothetical protein EON63_22175 [archaeon]
MSFAHKCMLIIIHICRHICIYIHVHILIHIHKYIHIPQVIDYDSYRRRLKGLREKFELMETQGKGQSQTGQEVQAEIAKFEGKEHVARESYRLKNAGTKEEIVLARKTHDELINRVLVSTVVSQVWRG